MNQLCPLRVAIDARKISVAGVTDLEVDVDLDSFSHGHVEGTDRFAWQGYRGVQHADGDKRGRENKEATHTFLRCTARASLAQRLLFKES